MSQTVIIGNTVPDLPFVATNSVKSSLAKLLGKNIVLYFYPRDSTPGCTVEGQEFNELIQKFNKLNTCIFGISKDSLTSHEKFKEKYNFSFDLISDPDESLCRLFDVIKQKSMYGKQYYGIERSTFLIDKNGILYQEWRKVKVKGHAGKVLEATKDLE